MPGVDVPNVRLISAKSTRESKSGKNSKGAKERREQKRVRRKLAGKYATRIIKFHLFFSGLPSK